MKDHLVLIGTTLVFLISFFVNSLPKYFDANITNISHEELSKKYKQLHMWFDICYFVLLVLFLWISCISDLTGIYKTNSIGSTFSIYSLFLFIVTFIIYKFIYKYFKKGN